MVSGKNIQIYQVQENKDERGVSNTLFIIPRHLDEPPFTLEQEKALYETAEAFLLVNRARDRNKRKARKRREGASHEGK